MENLCHLEGMLDRDQRTAKLRFFRRFFNSDKQVPKTYSISEKTGNESSSNPNSIISHHCCCPTRTKNSMSSYLTRKNRYLLRGLQSFTNVLIVGVYLTLVTLPSTSSAPTNVKMSLRMKEREKWINPCGLQLNSSNSTDLIPDHSGSSDSDLLNQIVNQANIALVNAEGFKDNFADKTFSRSFEGVHNLFQEQPRWLDMDVPKSLGGEIPEDVLKTLKIDETLLDVYAYLQKVAVGLEQVVWDQEDNQGQFVKEFADTEQHLKNVLCELQMTIIDRGIKMRPDVTRDVMKDEERHMNITETKVRDWRIFREYMNTLEYIDKAFKYFVEKMS